MSQPLDALEKLWAQFPRHFLDRRCYTQKSIMDDPAELQSMLSKVPSNRFLQYWKKHTLQQGDAGALGEVSRVIVEAALPELIGREMCWTVETTDTKVRFPRATKGKAQVRAVGGTGAVEIIPERMDFVDVEASDELISPAAYTDSYLEDAAWPAVQRATVEAGRAVGEEETKQIVALFDAIAAGSLAGGAEVTKGTPMTAANLTDTIANVRIANYRPDKVFLNPAEFRDLKKDANFIDDLRWGEALDKERGEVARMIDGTRVFVSSLITAGKAYVADSRWACGLVVRRDLVVEPFDKRDQLLSGVIASSRVGYKVLRSTAVARCA